MILKDVIIFIIFVQCNAFEPNRFSGIETDYSHESITEKALHIAAAEYIAKYLQPGTYNQSNLNAINTIKQYFKGDSSSLKSFEDVVRLIIQGNNNAQKQYGGNAMYTMNSEQIMEGNLKLQTKRNTIIRLSKSGQPDWNFIRTAVGEYLMTLQMFYSNTNWIEQKGQTVNAVLGIRGQDLQPVATSDMATCIDCDISLSALKSRSCGQNLIDIGDYLTSGYRSGQDIPKPQSIWASGVGKCSHGGSKDESRFTSARGGINKETSNPALSPHFYLHQKAGEAAIQATVQFLIGSGTGLLDTIGAGLFGDFLNIHNTCYNCLDPKLSLTFVIDTTGSMSNDIFAVRQTTIDIVNKAISGNGVADYVLATFNDPVTSTVKVTTNGETMKTWLNALQAHGGGDCPEYAMHGLLAGIQSSRPGSCLFFFTDADPKDPGLEAQVVNQTKSKNIHLLLFLRGQCSGELVANDKDNPKCIQKSPRGQSGRHKRSLSSWGMFGSLIAATSAAAVKVPKGAISKTIGDIIDSSTDISPVFIANFTMKSTNFSFPIDSTTNLFTVRASNVNSVNNVILIRPDGKRQTFINGSATRDDIGQGTVVLSVIKPASGIWVLQKSRNTIWEVIVKGEGNIDFTSTIMEDIDGVKYPISGTSPISGSNLTLAITVNGLDNESSVEEIVLRSINDIPVVKLQLNDTGSSSSRFLQAEFEIPSQPFRVTIEGTDPNGNTFRRTAQEMTVPVTGDLEIVPILDNLVKGVSTPINYLVTNAGLSKQSFTVSVKDSQNFLQFPKQKAISMDPQTIFMSSFNITGRNESAITLVTIQLKQGSKILQSKTISLLVAETVPPSFETLKQSDDCPESVMNSVNCTFGNWWIETLIDFSQRSTQVSVPSSSNSVHLLHSPLNETGLVSANISGDCCVATTKLVAIDSADNIAELPLDFTGGQIFRNIIPQVEHNIPPIFSSVSSSSSCSSQFMNSVNCTYGEWWTTIAITFDSVGTAVYVFPESKEVDNKSYTLMVYDDLKLFRKIVNVNISGVCCIFNTTLIANDSSGHSSRVEIDFSGGLHFQFIVPEEKYTTLEVDATTQYSTIPTNAQEPLKDKSALIPEWAVIVVVVVSILIVLIILTIAINKLKKKNKSSTNFSHELY